MSKILSKRLTFAVSFSPKYTSYFKKSESFQGENSSEYHGFDGPLSVTRAKRTDDLLLDKFIEAGQQAGHPLTEDFNGKYQEGVSRYEHTMLGSKRCSASKAYLHPALKRKNLETKLELMGHLLSN